MESPIKEIGKISEFANLLQATDDSKHDVLNR